MPSTRRRPPLVRLIGAPMSSVSSSASSSKCRSTMSAIFRRSCWRSNGFHLLHGPSKARRAAATARSMSTRSPSATWASVSPVAGLMLGKVLPDAAATHFPSINIFFGPLSRKAGRTPAAEAVFVVITGFLLVPRSIRATLRGYSPRQCPLPSSLSSSRRQAHRQPPTLIPPRRHRLLLTALLARQPLLGPVSSLAPATPQCRILHDRAAPDPGGQIGAERVQRVHGPQRRDHQRATDVVAERRLVLLGGQPVAPQVRVGEVAEQSPADEAHHA